MRIVSELSNIDNDLAASMEWAVAEIKKIQHAARSGAPLVKPRWPMLILRTPKGLGGPKLVHGEFVEGSFHAHQVPLPLAKTDANELAELQAWLQSYVPQELFTREGVPNSKIVSIIPTSNGKKLGQKKESYDAYQPLTIPDWRDLCATKELQVSCMKSAGSYIREVISQYVHHQTL